MYLFVWMFHACSHFILGHSIVCVNDWLKNAALINHINITFPLIFRDRINVSSLYSIYQLTTAAINFLPYSHRTIGKILLSQCGARANARSSTVTRWLRLLYGTFYSRLYSPTVLFPSTPCPLTPSPLWTFRN